VYVKLVIALIIGIVIGVAGVYSLGSAPFTSITPPIAVGPRPQAEIRPTAIPTPPSNGGTAPSADAGDAPSQVYDRVSAGVVNITISAQSRDVFGRTIQQQGTGSGFIIDDQGSIVTNQHVVSNAQRLDITLADGSSYIGEVVASDVADDLALVRLQAPADKLRQLTIVRLGDSGSLKVGQTVVAIGNPFGLERSESLGIVSSLGRTRQGIEQRLITNMIQTDAAINPGNSGGPLLNLQGEVIGINEQIEASPQGNVGIGFAIPVNTLKRYLPDLLAGREPKHAWLGIAGRALTPSLAEQLHTPVQQGVVLANTTPGGPAAQAGLLGSGRGDASGADIITEIDGHPVRSVEDIAQLIDQKDPGDTIRVTYVRGGQNQTADVTLGTWENSQASAR